MLVDVEFFIDLHTNTLRVTSGPPMMTMYKIVKILNGVLAKCHE